MGGSSTKAEERLSWTKRLLTSSIVLACAAAMVYPAANGDPAIVASAAVIFLASVAALLPVAKWMTPFIKWPEPSPDNARPIHLLLLPVMSAVVGASTDSGMLLVKQGSYPAAGIMGVMAAGLAIFAARDATRAYRWLRTKESLALLS